MTRKLLLVFFLSIFAQSAFAFQTSAQAGDTYSIFYLAVGSTRYLSRPIEKKDEKSFFPVNQPFPNIVGATKSAKNMASYMDRIGAVYGITLLSDESRLVSRTDVISALDKLLEKVKASKAKNPLIIFYFCGHGVSEGIAWNHFSLPGNFNLYGDEVDIELMSDYSISTGEVATSIEKVSTSYLLMLDSCYEGEEPPLSALFFSEKLQANMVDIFNVLRAANEFRGPGMAIFAAAPGTTAKIAADPFDAASTIGIGRIARRSLLVIDRAIRNKNPLPVAQFFQQISDPNFDKPTLSVITKSVPANPQMKLIKSFKPGLADPVNIIFGTGSRNTPLEKGVRKIAQPQAIVEGNADSYLSFESPAGEFIGQGKNMALRAGDYKISVTDPKKERLDFWIENDGATWMLTFAAPQNKILAAGSYQNAKDPPTPPDASPGLNFSGDGRGCSEIQGQFEITEIEWDGQGKLVKFRASFSQTCDDLKPVLKGVFQFYTAK